MTELPVPPQLPPPPQHPPRQVALPRGARVPTKLALTLLIGVGIWTSVFFSWSVWAWSHDTGTSSHAFIYNRTWVNLAVGVLPGISTVGGAMVAFGTGTIKRRVQTAAIFLVPSLLVATWLVFGTARWGVCGIPGSPCGWPT